MQDTESIVDYFLGKEHTLHIESFIHFFIYLCNKGIIQFDEVDEKDELKHFKKKMQGKDSLRYENYGTLTDLKIEKMTYKKEFWMELTEVEKSQQEYQNENGKKTTPPGDERDYLKNPYYKKSIRQPFNDVKKSEHETIKSLQNLSNLNNEVYEEDLRSIDSIKATYKNLIKVINDNDNLDLPREMFFYQSKFEKQYNVYLSPRLHWLYLGDIKYQLARFLKPRDYKRGKRGERGGKDVRGLRQLDMHHEKLSLGNDGFSDYLSEDGDSHYIKHLGLLCPTIEEINAFKKIPEKEKHSLYAIGRYGIYNPTN